MGGRSAGVRGTVKTEVLDTVCAVTGFDRDYARRALKRAKRPPCRACAGTAGREYDARVVAALEKCWVVDFDLWGAEAYLKLVKPEVAESGFLPTSAGSRSHRSVRRPPRHNGSGADPAAGRNLGRLAQLAAVGPPCWWCCCWAAPSTLSGAHLPQANLEGANHVRADLAHADLTATDLSAASLVGTTPTRANTSDANL